MEPAHNPPARSASDASTPCFAELVLQNGRRDGTRLSLTEPCTLIGQGVACEVRLQAPRISRLHCALVQTPGGLVLRDLLSDEGTLVNGHRVSACTLRDGDVVSIGPFEFVVHPLSDGPAAGNLPLGAAALHDMELLLKEKDALRIQVAAVVAQQAALTEEEVKLQQRALALQRQEEQLAAHLEEKRAQLLGLQEQVSDAREALGKERAEHEQQARESLQNLERDRKEAAASQQDALAERKSLQEFHRQLKRRWHRHWAAERAVMHRREQEVLEERRRLEQANEKVLVERAALSQSRLRFNGDAELGRRQLQAGRDQLATDQRDWRDRRAREHAELRRQAQALSQREMLLLEIERELLDDKQRWEGTRLQLTKEVEGLENRVRNQRRRMLEQQQESIRPETPVDSPGAAVESAVPVPVPDPDPAGKSGTGSGTGTGTGALVPRCQASVTQSDRLELLEKLTGELADQRLHLAEQYQRLVWIEADWQQARVALLDELENAAISLDRREEAVATRERSIEPIEAHLRRRRDELAQARCQVDACESRLTARESAWENERATLQARLRTREELVKRHREIMANLRRRWSQRRRQETSQMQAEHQRFQEARQQYATLWEECLRRSAALDQEKRAAAEQTLAMEQYRLELVGQSDDAVSVERALERLRRRWAALAAAAERRLAGERQALEAEAGRLEARSRHIEQQAAEVLAREQQLSKQQTKWEHHQAMDEEEQARLHQELENLRAERVWRDRQLADLRNEVERMAVSLLEEAQPPVLPDAKAA
jgi:pSer/pThr/pTyr-binding forkhead associated (FHA) protein